ncbi:hypothetical protein ABH935_002632 [Catenulispora sp. GAS73]
MATRGSIGKGLLAKALKSTIKEIEARNQLTRA